MDFLIFHSQFSPSSQKLLEDFPALREKAVSVDSGSMRVYVKKLKIVCVPTLLVLLGGQRVIDRVVGYDSISNWLIESIYRVNQLQSGAPPTAMQEDPEVLAPVAVEGAMNVDPSVPQASFTNLDDLVLEQVDTNAEEEDDRDTPLVQTGMSANTMALAEQMKKERDNLDPNVNKKKFQH